MRTPMRFARRERGVTLMELITVVAVVGILAGIATPAYNSYVIRAKRTDAKSELLALAQRLERCYTRDNTYTGCLVLPQNTPIGATGSRVTYVITGNPADQAFTLTATPQNGQARDTKCGTFTLNQVGGRTVSGSMTWQACWQGRGG